MFHTDKKFLSESGTVWSSGKRWGWDTNRFQLRFTCAKLSYIIHKITHIYRPMFSDSLSRDGLSVRNTSLCELV